MSKRILALVLVLCMVCTLMPMSVMAQQDKTGFTDVEESAFFYEPVLWAVENGITNGMTETTFAPGVACNRGQMATFLWRAAGKPAVAQISYLPAVHPQARGIRARPRSAREACGAPDLGLRTGHAASSSEHGIPGFPRYAE